MLPMVLSPTDESDPLLKIPFQVFAISGSVVARCGTAEDAVFEQVPGLMARSVILPRTKQHADVYAAAVVLVQERLRALPGVKLTAWSKPDGWVEYTAPGPDDGLSVRETCYVRLLATDVPREHVAREAEDATAIDFAALRASLVESIREDAELSDTTRARLLQRASVASYSTYALGRELASARSDARLHAFMAKNEDTLVAVLFGALAGVRGESLAEMGTPTRRLVLLKSVKAILRGNTAILDPMFRGQWFQRLVFDTATMLRADSGPWLVERDILQGKRDAG